MHVRQKKLAFKPVVSAADNDTQRPQLTQSAKSQLPKILDTAKPKRFVDTFPARNPGRTKDQFNRLSGLTDSINATGLATENAIAMDPRPLCVRCGSTPHLCMSCSDMVCENAVTFYRKTRAAGAAALFTKAFSEAGNSKLVKFFVFRLLKNSFIARYRKQAKMLNVVDKLFGQNIVLVPFSAWRKFAKDNVLRRKDKTISQLQEKVKFLEQQIMSFSADKLNAEKKVEKICAELEDRSGVIAAQTIEIGTLRDELKKERERVVGLCSLAQPLQTYSTLVDSFLFQESRIIRHYLQYASKNIASYNYSNIFDDSVLRDLMSLRLEREHRDYFTASVYKTNLRSEIAVSAQIVMDWLFASSEIAGHHNEYSSGKLLNNYLPSSEKISTLADLRTGKDLSRVVVGLIYDMGKRLDSMNLLLPDETNQSSAVASTPKAAVERKRRLSVNLGNSVNTSSTVTLEDLRALQALEEDPLDLVTYTLKLAVRFLQVPMFKALDIFAGKSDVIYAFCVALMMTSSPVVTQDESSDTNEHIQQFQTLMLTQEKIFENKKNLANLKEISRNRSMYLGENLREIGHTPSAEMLIHLGAQSTDPTTTGAVAGIMHQSIDEEELEEDENSLERLSLQEENAEDASNAGASVSNGASLTRGEGLDYDASSLAEAEAEAGPDESTEAHDGDSGSAAKRGGASGAGSSGVPRIALNSGGRASFVAAAGSAASTPAIINRPRAGSVQMTSGRRLSTSIKSISQEDSYMFLTEAVDDFLKRRDDEKLAAISFEDVELCNNFLHLQSATSKTRQKREIGMHMSTELRRFVNAKFFESSMRKLGILAEELNEI